MSFNLLRNNLHFSHFETTFEKNECVSACDVWCFHSFEWASHVFNEFTHPIITRKQSFCFCFGANDCSSSENNTVYINYDGRYDVRSKVHADFDRNLRITLFLSYIM